jgi:alcohol dehydrogenase (cytochrome c)
MHKLRFLACSTFALGIAFAQNPDAGRRAYESRCSRCHGGDATGGETGPNIVAQLGSRNDGDLAAFLRAGKPASGMPAFDLADPEMGPLVGYLRSLVPISRTAPP